MVTFPLVVVGALNWGLIGLFRYNLVHQLLAFSPSLENLAYILVGVSAVYLLATHMGDCKLCSKK